MEEWEHIEAPLGSSAGNDGPSEEESGTEASDGSMGEAPLIETADGSMGKASLIVTADGSMGEAPLIEAKDGSMGEASSAIDESTEQASLTERLKKYVNNYKEKKNKQEHRRHCIEAITLLKAEGQDVALNESEDEGLVNISGCRFENLYENIVENDNEEECETIEQREVNTCRICFDSDPVEELFRPCRCSGTMLYVHMSCLEAWRVASHNARSSYQCDQCKYEYKMGTVVNRLLLVRVLRSPFAVELASIVVLFLLVFVAGFITKLIAPDISRPFLKVDFSHFYGGATVVGTGAFAGSIFRMLRVIDAFNSPFGVGHNVKLGGICKGDIGSIIQLLLVVAGLVYALYQIHKSLTHYVKDYMAKYSNKVLDIPPEELQTKHE